MSQSARGQLQHGQANHNRRIKAIESTFVRAAIPDGILIPDGTTDNTAAIQASVTANAGGILRFIAGTYRLNNVLLPSAGIHLVGAGIGKTILKYNGSAGATDIFKNPNQPAAGTVFVSHTGTRTGASSFTIPTDLTDSYRPGRQLYINGTLTGIIRGIIETSVFGATTAVTFTGAGGATINAGDATVTVSVAELATPTDQHYSFERMTLDGNNVSTRCVFIKGAESLIIREVEVKNADVGHGFRCQYIRRVDIDGMWGHDVNGNAAGIEGCDHVTVSNCRVHDCSDHGIGTNACRRVSFVGVQSSDNDAAGMAIEAEASLLSEPIGDNRTERVSISNCNSENNGSLGLLLGSNSCRYIRVNGGTYSYNRWAGIGGASSSKGDTGEISIVNTEACYNGLHGIALTGFLSSGTISSFVHRTIVSNNTCLNNGQDGSGAGIYVPTANNDNLIITGNQCYDTQATPTQDYGIEAPNTGILNTLIAHNDVSTYQTAPMRIALDSDTCIVRDNLLGDNNPSFTTPTAATSTIDATLGQQLYRLIGSGSVTSILGAYIGQEVTLVAKEANWVLRNNTTLRLHGSADFAMPVNAASTFKMVTDAEWYEVARTYRHQSATLASASGGGVIDTECRTLTNGILAHLQSRGEIA